MTQAATQQQMEATGFARQTAGLPGCGAVGSGVTGLLRMLSLYMQQLKDHFRVFMWFGLFLLEILLLFSCFIML